MGMTTKPQENISDATEHSTNKSRLVRCKEVERFTGLKRGAIYQRVREGLLTPPVRIGKRASAWPQHEINAVNHAIVAGQSDDELRALVSDLVAQRTEGAGQ